MINKSFNIYKYLIVSWFMTGVLLTCFFTAFGNLAPTIKIAKSDIKQVSFGLNDVSKALTEKQMANSFISSQNKATISWQIASKSNSLKPEGYSIKKENGKVLIIGSGIAGVMYGALELAEQIRLAGWDQVKDVTHNPHMEIRGVKFNIPLDVRTPSYTDASNSAQLNIPTMWNFNFWKNYIDHLAKHRYNYVSLWSLHPFPSLVKVPEYPEIALNDIQRSTTQWKEEYHTHGTGLDSPEILANPEIIKRISIEDKINFWQKVMEYGKSRNVKFLVITWNVFTNGTAGKYGITDKMDNEITRDYFRKSIRELFITYPYLAGIGLTTGENMSGATVQQKEDWAYDTYGRAMQQVASEMPQRNFIFVHRQHQASAKEIALRFKPLIDLPNVEFIFSFKYAKAHVYSAVKQSYHEKFLEDIGNFKTIWELRNDDVYRFRWGAPDFVREFVQNIPIKQSRGMLYGSDQWVWGGDHLSKDLSPDTFRLEIEKHWYQWMLWGRLTYNADLDNHHFQKVLQYRFPKINAVQLFEAWQYASMVYPVTTGFHWGASDFQWYIEGCKSRKKPAQNETGFHDVNRFISLPPHPKSGYQSIPDYVKSVISGSSSSLKSPLLVAQMLNHQARQAQNLIETIHAEEGSELKAIINDIQTMAFMGQYYAQKISGATYLALYRERKNAKDKEKAISHLTEAMKFWNLYANVAIKQNVNPIWTNRVGYVDWIKTAEFVAEDIEIARK